MTALGDERRIFPADVLVLIGQPLPLPVDETITWEELMPSPTDLMLSQGGVALEDSADAARCYPNLWPSPAAARQAFHRARCVTNPNRDFSYGECHAPLRRAAYQRAGAGKRRAALAFDPAVVAPDKLQEWLQERLGSLARFEIEPSPPPDPPRPEPAGPPQTKSGSEVREHQGNPAYACTGKGALGSFSDLEYQPAGSEDCGLADPALAAVPARAPAEANGGPGSDTPPESAEAPPGPPTAPPTPSGPAPIAEGPPAEQQAAKLRQQRLRLAALAERLQDARPKRTHAMRELDRQAYQDAAREAAGLPNDAWVAWRTTFGTAAAGWPPRPPGPPSNAGAHR